MTRIVLLFGIFLAIAMPAEAGKISNSTGTFFDADRGRKIPYKISFPKPLEGRYAVIVISHPLGGSRDSNELLGRHLASNGFIVVHVQHEGSDESLLRGISNRRMAPLVLAQSLRDPANARNRFQDIPFVISQLTRLNDEDKQFKDHLNLDALGMAGHSYGATSTMVAAGEQVGLAGASFKVPSLRAGLTLSPSPPTGGTKPEQAYKAISIPLFHVTGTMDVSLVEGRGLTAADRTKPYRALSIPNQYLLVLDGADHTAFSNESRDKRAMAAVLNGALAFFQAYLSNDKSAESWLQNEFRKTLTDRDVFEKK